MDLKRNYTIDLLCLFMAFLIVSLRCNLLAEYNAVVSYFLSQVLSRIGVPFFATVAGYYFFQNEKTEKYFIILQKYFEKYTIWSAVFFTYEFAVYKMWVGAPTRYGIC